MLALLLTIFLIWLFFKLGWGIIEILAFLTVIAFVALIFTYLLLPLLGIALFVGLLWAIVR